MKVNVITLLIAFAVAALIGYGFFAVNGAAGDVPLANALGGGLVLFITLSGAISVSVKDASGGTINIRVASIVFFVVMLIEQIVFCFVPFSLPPYIIITGILILIYVLIAYAIGKALQNG
jgi:hypothetical protein